MDNTFLRIIFLLLVFPATTYILAPKAAAQIIEQENANIHFGLTIGGAANTVFPSPSPWTFERRETKVGVTGGAYFQYDFAKRFFLHIEVGVADRKILSDGISADSGDFYAKVSYTNIAIPVGVGINFLPKESDFNISLTLCAVAGLPQQTSGEIGIGGRNVEKNVYPINIGGAAALRFRYRFIFLDLRYELTGTPVLKCSEQAFRNGSFSFMLGFQLF